MLVNGRPRKKCFIGLDQDKGRIEGADPSKNKSLITIGTFLEPLFG